MLRRMSMLKTSIKDLSHFSMHPHSVSSVFLIKFTILISLSQVLSIEERMKKVIDDNQSLEEKVKHLEKERKNFEKKYVQVCH